MLFGMRNFIEQFDSDRRLIVKKQRKSLVEKGYLAATGGNISVRIKKEMLLPKHRPIAIT